MPKHWQHLQIVIQMSSVSQILPVDEYAVTDWLTKWMHLIVEVLSPQMSIAVSDGVSFAWLETLYVKSVLRWVTQMFESSILVWNRLTVPDIKVTMKTKLCCTTYAVDSSRDNRVSYGVNPLADIESTSWHTMTHTQSQWNSSPSCVTIYSNEEMETVVVADKVHCPIRANCSCCMITWSWTTTIIRQFILSITNHTW